MLDELGIITDQAIIAFVERSIIPIIAEVHDPLTNALRVGTEGTGTLFHFNDSFYIITAAHVIMPYEKKIKYLGIPLKQNNSKIVHLDSCSFFCQNDDELRDKLDIGIIKLTTELANSLQENYRFLTYENLEFKDVYKYVYVSGFPYKFNKLESNHLIGTPFRFRSVLKLPTEEDCIKSDQKVHLLINYPEYYYINGDKELKIKSEDDLHGISGCPVWTIINKQNEVWAPEKYLKIIGIQQSVMNGKWIKATNFIYVLASFKEVDVKVYEEFLRIVKCLTTASTG